VTLSGTGIVDGTQPLLNEYPWFALMQGSYICGGALVTPEYVLTAAHCMYNGFESNGGYKIGAYDGTTNNNGGQAFEAILNAAVYIHPEYISSTFDNDFALVKLRNRVESTVPVIMDIGLESISDAYDSDKPVWPIGFGTTSSGGNLSNKLLHVEVGYKTNEDCNAAYRGQITDNMMCASDPGQDACQGDSGGPLYDKEDAKLVGIVSWGRGCARPGYPGVYARISSQKSWIQQTICTDHSEPKPGFCSTLPPTSSQTLPPTTSPTSSPQTLPPTTSPTSSPQTLPPTTSSTSSPQTLPPTSDECQDGVGTYNLNRVKKRNCRWTSRRPEKRCKKVNAADYCKVTCLDPVEPACTPFDTEGEFAQGKRQKDCDWVAEWPVKRCKKNASRSNCPVTCNGYSYDFQE